LLYRRRSEGCMAVLTSAGNIPSGQYQLPVYALHVLDRPREVAA
jgi:hypothetical protein